MDKLSNSYAKTVFTGIASGAGEEVSRLVQENVYDRENILKPVSEFLHNPNYLTSFTYPLALMVTFRSISESAREFNNTLFKNKQFDTALDVCNVLLPFAIEGANVLHEVLSHPDYPDNPGLDVLAGFVAGAVYIMNPNVRNDFTKILNKFKNTQMSEAELLGM